MRRISAVIINYNKRELLLRCLSSIRAQTQAPDEVIVIDNGSTDGSVDSIKDAFYDIIIIQNNRNMSFAYAANQGISRSSGEFVLLLNNDIVLDKRFIEALSGSIKHDEKLGMAGGKVLSADGRYIDSAGQFLARSRKVIDRGYREPDRGQYDTSSYVFGIGASAALYRRSMLEEIKEDSGYFDNDFEFFYEDMDLAWRAQRKGWKARYEPLAIAYHVRGATAKTECAPRGFLNNYYIPQLKEGLQLCAVRNRYLMILKNDNIMNFIKDSPFILLYEIGQALYIFLFAPSLMISLLGEIKSGVNKLRRRILKVRGIMA